MSLTNEKEKIAVEINYLIADPLTSSLEVAEKIKQYLELSYPYDIGKSQSYIADLVPIVKERRNGLSLEATIDKIISLFGKEYDLDVPLLSWESDSYLKTNSNANSVPIWTTLPLPGLVPIYSLGEFHLKSGIINYDPYNWLDCIGQNVFCADFNDLYFKIKADITKFETEANALCQRYFNIYIFTESIAANGATMFSVPNIPDFSLKAR